MEYLKFKSLLRRVIIVPLVVTSAFAGLLLWETFDLNRSILLVDHTDQVLDRSGSLLKLLVDMESAKRGYVATGDETFLHPYMEGTKRFEPEFQAPCIKWCLTKPQQQQRLNRIHASYKDSESYDRRIIALRRSGKADPSLLENQPEQIPPGHPPRPGSGAFQGDEEECCALSVFKQRTGAGS